MELDLTRLNSLAFLDFAGEKKAPKKPSEEQISEGEYKTLTEPKKPLELNTEGLEGIRQLQREADRKKQDIDRSLAIYREYQQNIKTSSQLQTELLKGARAGEDIYSLFLKAVKAISLMTSNNLFYSQLEGDIRAIYGRGLQEAPAIDIELEQVTERYIRLLSALEREPDGDSRDRIKQAVKAHENKIRDYIKVLSEYGTQAGEPYIKHLDGEIWELRPLRDRILFIGWANGSYVLLHQFMKKTQKTPAREIEKAKRELADLIERGVKYE